MKTLVTHSGGFHADDVLAYAILQIYFDRKGEATNLVRSRDKADFDAADVVFDVGGAYDPATHRYDHHQKGRAGERDNGIPYAAAGLVWKHLGRELCSSDDAWQRFDEQLVQPIDAHDNGFDIVSELIPGIQEFSIGKVLGIFNPESEDPTAGEQMEAFKSAAAFMRTVVEKNLAGIERRIANQAVLLELFHAAPGPIVESPKNYGRGVWGVLSEIPEALFVTYPDSQGTWRAEGIRTPDSNFQTKHPFPESWRGLTDDALAAACGVPDAKFCHPGGFLAGAKTREGALELAKKAILM